ncbi:MAG TPA: hypothetical protein VMC83_26585 [Streptosporangiaceae bacterium]|jgi:hypothetical protein|nr:hypothetical protein [Streptosporangiaceae bacterium]
MPSTRYARPVPQWPDGQARSEPPAGQEQAAGLGLVSGARLVTGGIVEARSFYADVLFSG